MDFLLKNSPHLSQVPAVHLAKAVVLTDASYPSWTAMFDANPTKLDYLLTKGDYRNWGTLELLNLPGNIPKRPKMIRYYNPGVDDALHPVQRWCGAEVDSLRFRGKGTTNWLVQGLTVRKPTTNPGVQDRAGNITVDFCLIENADDHSFRILASDVTVQRCVIRNSVNKHCNQGFAETIGIQVKEIAGTIRHVKLLDNEIWLSGHDRR